MTQDAPPMLQDDSATFHDDSSRARTADPRRATDGGVPTESVTAVEDADAFYSRWARGYDLLARRAPGLRRLRRRAVDALRLDRGDTVLEVGCGTGANLPLLARAVGPTGTVLGLDVAGGALRRARRTATGYPQVEVLRADGADPPLAGSVDAVLATFVVGMFREPERVVDGWCDLVPPGGHVVCLHLRRSEHWSAPVANRALGAFTVLSTPPSTQLGYEQDLLATLDERVRAGHRRVEERAAATAHSSHLLDLVELVGGRME